MTLIDFLHRGGGFAHYWTPDTGEFYTDKDTGEQKERKHSLWFPVDKRPPIPAAWKDRNVYFCVHPQNAIPAKTNKAGNPVPERYIKAWVRQVAAINCFFAEYDAKHYGGKDAILAHLKTLPLSPSVIVDSGGGFHCYFLLDTPYAITDKNRDTVKAIQYAWVDLVKSDNDAKDLARVLRVPGTKNFKPAYAPNFPTVSIIEEDYTRLYTLEQFDQLTQDLRKEEQRKIYTGAQSFTNDLETATRCLRSLSPSRRENYQEWIEVGMALSSLHATGLQLWDEWSQGSGKYKPGDCAAKWKTFNSNEGLGIGSLVNWAKHDDSNFMPKAYTNGYSKAAEDKTTEGTDRPMPARPTEPQDDSYLLAEGAHDEGNAQCTKLRYKNSILHSKALGWLYHTGAYWSMSESEAAVDRAIIDTLIARMTAAANAKRDNEMIKKFVPSSGHMQGAKILLRSLVSVQPEQFDYEPDFLNCRNGVVDLRTGEIFPHSSGQRFLHCTTIDYRPDANPTPWINWLEDAVGKEAADWLQIAAGYGLTGHTREEVLFYLFGPSRSGKGTFTETMIALLGNPLAREVDFGTFIAQRTGDSQNFDLAPLKPCRFIAASETNSYERFNEAKIKKLTGGNDIYCAFKHRDHFNYKPQFKIWLSSNQPVNADPDDDAVWGRIRVVEFPHSHLGNEDKALKAAMRSDAVMQGVLSWAVVGAQLWYELDKKGLPELETSRRAKETQRADLDNVQTWIDERCYVGADAFGANDTIYPNYEAWCKSNGVEPKKQKGFSQSLKRKGYKDDRNNAGKRGFRGFGLSTNL